MYGILPEYHPVSQKASATGNHSISPRHENHSCQLCTCFQTFILPHQSFSQVRTFLSLHQQVTTKDFSLITTAVEVPAPLGDIKIVPLKAVAWFHIGGQPSLL